MRYCFAARQTVGILTERDVTWKVAAKGLDPKNVRVAEVMSAPLIAIDPNADLTEAAKIMKKQKIQRLAVVKEGALQGVLTATDVARNLENYMDKEIRDILGYLWTPRYLPEEG
jgi:signal-transduction protein with cAMP-binding, CBS, and nucleotidyltransferase domain